MPTPNPQLVQALKRHLEKECKLYESYLELLQKQRDCLTKFRSDEMSLLDDKRARLSDEMKTLEASRFALLSEVTRGEGRRLSEIVQEKFLSNEKAILLPIVDRLKALVMKARTASQEFYKLTHFALNMVNGTLSIFSHASQNVTTCYNPTGKVRESYSPTSSRHERVIKSA